MELYFSFNLLKPEIRESVEKTSELLIDGFTEFTSSGYIYNYNMGQVVNGKIKWRDFGKQKGRNISSIV